MNEMKKLALVLAVLALVIASPVMALVAINWTFGTAIALTFVNCLKIVAIEVVGSMIGSAVKFVFGTK
jgi:hypothetical protein